jgi:hypothetical protein
METNKEKFKRVELMASGDETWDFSPNDIAALKYILDELCIAIKERDLAIRERDEARAKLDAIDFWFHDNAGMDESISLVANIQRLYDVSGRLSEELKEVVRIACLLCDRPVTSPAYTEAVNSLKYWRKLEVKP